MINIIDGSKSLTSELLQQFANKLSNEDSISFNVESESIKHTTKQNIANDILVNGLSDSQITDSAIFSLSTNVVTLTFNGADYKWWKKTSKRIEKFNLFFCNTQIEIKEKKEKKKKLIENEQDYTVAVAYCIDNYLSNIQWFHGQKSQAIEFINNDIFKKLSSTSITAKVVVNLAFDNDEFNNIFTNGTEEQKQAYYQNIEMWYTLDELEEIGAISIK